MRENDCANQNVNSCENQNTDQNVNSCENQKTNQNLNPCENQNTNQNVDRDAGHRMKCDPNMILASVVAFVPVIAGLILWFARPDAIRSDWIGQENTGLGGSRILALLGLPISFFLVHCMILLALYTDKKNRGQNRKIMTVSIWMLPFISLVVCSIIDAIVLEKDVSSGVLVRGILGVIFMTLGNYMPKCKQNRTIGVRVKWTLESEENWNRTHRFAGKVWFFTGLLIFVTMFTPLAESSAVFLAFVLIMSLAPVGYSYYFYRKQLQAGEIERSDMESKNAGEKPIKAVGILVTILSIVGAVLVLVTGKFQVEVGTSELIIDATFWDDATIAYDDITELSYRLQDDAGSRTFGYGTPSLLMGEFENQEFGSYTRYSYPSCQECIVITANGKIIVINGKSEAETKQLYEKLVEVIQVKNVTGASDTSDGQGTAMGQVAEIGKGVTNNQNDTNVTSISIVMVGDILLHTPVEKSAVNAQGVYDFTPIFAELKDDISAADLALVNQEVIIGGEELGISGYPAFNAPYAIADALVDTGFDVICQATNHAMDKGKRGILNDLAYWEEHYPEIVVAGIQDREEEWQQITTVRVKDITLAILNYTYGTNGISLPSDMPFAVDLLQEEKVKSDLQMAEEMADFTIVCPHWGTEYQLTPSKEQEKWKNIFLEGGADLVIGTHPHVIEPVEMVSDGEKNMLVYYSLGNFVNWTSGTGTGVANRMVGGMAQIELKKENDKVVINKYGMMPLVTHVEEGYGGVKTYALSDYSEAMGETNLIRKQDGTFSFTYAQELCRKVWGDLPSLSIEE